MTVCIAGISAPNPDLPMIVVVSDRLVSSRVSFESGASKIRVLARNVLVMMSSNDALASADIVKNVSMLIFDAAEKGEQLTVEQVVILLSNECKKRLKLEKERGILNENYDLTFDELKIKSKDLHDKIIQDIIFETKNFEYPFEAEFLVAGIDTNPKSSSIPIPPYSPHIYIVDQRGNYQSHDLLGFATIGEGGYLAFPEMTKFRYNAGVVLGEAIVRVYNSKKLAQRVGSVGDETDLWVLHVTPEDEVRLWIADEQIKKTLDDGIELLKNQELETYKSITNNLITMFANTSGTTTTTGTNIEKDKSKL